MSNRTAQVMTHEPLRQGGPNVAPNFLYAYHPQVANSVNYLTNYQPQTVYAPAQRVDWGLLNYGTAPIAAPAAPVAPRPVIEAAPFPAPVIAPAPAPLNNWRPPQRLSEAPKPLTRPPLAPLKAVSVSVLALKTRELPPPVVPAVPLAERIVIPKIVEQTEFLSDYKPAPLLPPIKHMTLYKRYVDPSVVVPYPAFAPPQVAPAISHNAAPQVAQTNEQKRESLITRMRRIGKKALVNGIALGIATGAAVGGIAAVAGPAQKFVNNMGDAINGVDGEAAAPILSQAPEDTVITTNANAPIETSPVAESDSPPTSTPIVEAPIPVAVPVEAVSDTASATTPVAPAETPAVVEAAPLPSLNESILNGTTTLADHQGEQLGVLRLSNCEDVQLFVNRPLNLNNQAIFERLAPWAKENVIKSRDPSLPKEERRRLLDDVYERGLQVEPSNLSEPAVNGRGDPLYDLYIDNTPTPSLEECTPTTAVTRASIPSIGSSDAIDANTTADIWQPVASVSQFGVAPNGAGVTLIVGHNKTQSAAFNSLKTTSTGDIIGYTDNGSTTLYTQIDRLEIDPTGLTVSQVIAMIGEKVPAGSKILALQSCNDDGSGREFFIYIAG